MCSCLLLKKGILVCFVQYFLSLLSSILQAQLGLWSWNFTCPVRILQVSDIGLVLSFEDCGRPTWPWPSDLNINRDHLLIMGYLRTRFEAYWAKCSWVISCTRSGRWTWPLTLTLDLLTWISIGIIYSSRTTKFEASGRKCSRVISCTRCGKPTWPLTLTFHLLTWISIGIIFSSRTTKFEASGGKCSRVISCTRCGRPTWPLTFHLLTWISIGIIYSSRTSYLPILKLLEQSVLQLSVAQG